LRRIRRAESFKSADYLLFGNLLEAAGCPIESGVDRSMEHPCRWNAFDGYQKAINLDPKSSAAYVHCANLLSNAGLPEFAVFFAEQAVKLRPWDMDLNLELANLQLCSYRRSEGLERLFHYLTVFTKADKWEKVEKLKLSANEKQSLLNRVRDHYREETSSATPAANVKNRIIPKVSKRGTDGAGFSKSPQ
jgi:hypothetical protein